MPTLDNFNINEALQNLFRLEPTAEEKRAAAYNAMGRMGLGILAGNQPSPTPRNSLGVLAQGGLAGMDTYRQQTQDALASRRTQAAGALAGTKVAAEIDKEKRAADAMDLFKNIGPDIMKDPQKLYQLGVQQSAAGNTALGNGLITIANHQLTQETRRDPSQMERALDKIAKFHGKHAMGQELTPAEQTDLHNSIAIVGQVRQALDPATQRLETYQPLTLPDIYKPMLDRYGVKLGKPADVFPPSPAGIGRKPVDQSSEKELQGFNDAGKQLTGLVSDLKPTYGGWMLDTVGQAALSAGRRLPESTLKQMGQPGLADQAAWWQRYYNWANDVRAAKFGLTLTGNELTAFERSTPKPSDRPEMIQKSLEQQLKIIDDKRTNRVEGLVAGGYNPDQVQATAGPERSVQQTEEAALAAVQDASRRGVKSFAFGPAPKVYRVKTDADYDMLPAGATFIGPDNKRRTKPGKAP